MNPQPYRYFLRLSYLGTNYHGWQIQPDSVSVQEVLQDALSLVLRADTGLTGAGRTDTGVHAAMFYAHFDSALCPESIRDMQLAFKVNRILPPDIAVHDILPVVPDAHARFSATSRTYQYHICTKKDPYRAGISWLYERALKLEALQEAANRLFHHSDFASFARSNTQVKTTICHIKQASWTQKGHMITFEVNADRFLRNMVRAMVGTMLDVGLEKLSSDNFEQIILSRDRRKAGKSAPACGLHLTGIEYPEETFI